jgi:hypothetical protein
VTAALGILALMGLVLWDADEVPALAVAIVAVSVAIVVVAVFVALRPRDFVVVDVAERRYTLTRQGRPAGSGGLDDLGPLVVRARKRYDHRRREYLRYAVSTDAHDDLDIHEFRTSGRARVRMEELARAWGLPCRSLHGRVRTPDELDLPLNERLRDDRSAKKRARLDPATRVFVETVPRGYALRSLHRTFEPLIASAMFLALAAFMLFEPARRLPAILEGEPVDRFEMGFALAVAAFFVGASWPGVRDAFFPGTVWITDRGVRYRRGRLRLAEVEEVTRGYPIEVCGDRRVLRLAETFCRRRDVKAVSHELQRLILEVAERNP